MSLRGLNEIIGKAVISDRFRAGLLTGKRAELIRQPEFELEPEEAMALMAINAENLAEFAIAVEQLVEQREPRPAQPSEIEAASLVRRDNMRSMGAFARH
jgi:hypothetical protein